MDENNNIPTPDELDAIVPTPDFLQGDNWFGVDVEPYRLNFSKAYEPPKYTLAWDGVGFAPLGGIHAITGQAGNGKTMTLAQFMAAILNGSFGSLSYNLSDSIPHPRVLYIDTEMEEANTIAVKNRVMTMCDRDISTNYDDFVVVMLREVPEAQTVTFDTKGRKSQMRVPAAVMRWRMVLKAIYDYKPTSVFIDGLLDVVSDFNDNIECQEIIYKCMQVASHYGISVWCVVHQNPGGDKLVGHLGSFLERKVTDIIQTKKEKKDGSATFTVSQKKTRGRDIDDWSFCVLPVEGWGMPEQITSTIQMHEQVSGDPIEEVERWLREAKDTVQWPATRQTIKEKIIRDYGKQKNKTKQDIDLKMLLNKRLLVESTLKQKGYYLLVPSEEEDKPFDMPKKTDEVPF